MFCQWSARDRSMMRYGGDVDKESLEVVEGLSSVEQNLLQKTVEAVLSALGSCSSMPLGAAASFGSST
eukprot:scaffold2352_cov153-Ochromonas_danica.AAC.2